MSASDAARNAPFDATARVAAIEAGGTKVIAALFDSGGAALERARIATRDPVTTLAEVRDFLAAAQERHGAAQAAGIASFGPVALDPRAADYAHLRATPKAGWAGTDLRAMLPNGLCDAPFGIDTDVNAAALAEQRHGAGRDCTSLAYVTVGTGIGVGLVLDGRRVHGALHPEAGHLWPRRTAGDDFPGICPFHGDCFEGLASGPAIAARFGASLDALPPDHLAWARLGDELGQLAAQVTLLASPQRIVMGGGVMSQRALFPTLRARAWHWLGGYLEAPAPQRSDDDRNGLDDFIVPAALGDDAGLRGAFELARDALAEAASARDWRSGTP
ncbi:MAG: ROK family protein [Silanimonas sp.]